MILLMVIGTAIGIATGLMSGHPVWGGIVGGILVRMFPPSHAYAKSADSVMSGGPHHTYMPINWIILGLAFGLIAGFGKNPWYWGFSAILGALLGFAVVAIDGQIMLRQCQQLRQRYLACVKETGDRGEEQAEYYIKTLHLSRILSGNDEEPRGLRFVKLPEHLDRLLRG